MVEDSELSEWDITIQITVEQTINVEAHDAEDARGVAQEQANEQSLNEWPEVDSEITRVEYRGRAK